MSMLTQRGIGGRASSRRPRRRVRTALVLLLVLVLVAGGAYAAWHLGLLDGFVEQSAATIAPVGVAAVDGERRDEAKVGGRLVELRGR